MSGAGCDGAIVAGGGGLDVGRRLLAVLVEGCSDGGGARLEGGLGGGLLDTEVLLDDRLLHGRGCNDREDGGRRTETLDETHCGNRSWTKVLGREGRRELLELDGSYCSC